MLNRKGIKLPFKQAVITITLFTARLMDYDGAYGSVKPLLDGLVGAGVIRDDSPKYIDLEVKQTKVKHIIEQKVTILIKEKLWFHLSSPSPWEP